MSDPWSILDSTDRTTRLISCPICGVRLDERLLARPDEEYFCPYCCTQQEPSVVSRRESSPPADSERTGS